MHLILALLFFYSLAYGSLTVIGLNAPSFPSGFSTLKAAKRHRDFLQRSNGISLTHEIELAYAEDQDHQSIFTTHVHLQADRPIILLEDFDHLLEDVECDGSTMRITAQRGGGFYDKAHNAWKGLKNAIVISSHHTCSDEGARSVYRVKDIVFNDEELQISLHVEESDIQTEFRSATIEFGHSSERYVVHRHDRLPRRQDTAPTLTDPVTTGTVTQSKEIATTVGLGFGPLETTFLNGSGLNPIELGCKECSAQGEMILTAGSLEIDLTMPFTGEDDDVIKSGFVQLEVPNFDMSILLRAVPSIRLPFEQINLVRPFTLPGTGFTIPGVGAIGIFVELNVALDVDVSGAVEISFGFDVKVPRSIARLDVAEFDNSDITGFDQTDITAKPLQTNVSDIALSMIIGLRPSIKAGLKFLSFVDLSIGPYLSLPEFNMTVTQLASTNVGANCEEKGDTVDEFKTAFQNLTHVDYSLGVAAGIEGPFGFDKKFVSEPIVAATQCLVYETTGTSTGLALATDVLESFTARPSASVMDGAKPKAASGSSARAGIFAGRGVAGIIGLGVAVAVVAF